MIACVLGGLNAPLENNGGVIVSKGGEMSKESGFK